MLEQNAPRLLFTLYSDLLGPQQLEHDPIGWEDVGVQLHRDPKYHGLTTEYTVELGFVKKGKVYLSQAYAAAGVEAEVELLIEIFDPNEFVWEEYYRGRVDFSNASETATEFRCQAEKTGFTMRFLNREDSTIDLFGRESVGGVALPVPEPVSVMLHSKAIQKRYEVVTPPEPLPSLPDYVTDGESRFKVLYFGFGSPEVDDFDIQETNSGTVTIPKGNNSPEVPIYTTQERGEFAIDVNILALLRIQRRDGQGDFDKAEGGVYFRINDETPMPLFEFKDADIAGEYRKQLSASHQVIRTLNIGDRVYLYGRLHVYDISGPIIGPYRFTVLLDMQPGSFFRMRAETQTEPTLCNGLLAYEALNRLTQAMTDNVDCFRSSFFGRTDTVPAYPQDGPGSLLLVTGGFQVRGFPLDKKSLFAAWGGLYDSLSDAYWLGVGIERLFNGGEIVRVEQASYFYSDEIVLTLEAPVLDYLPDEDGTRISNLIWQVLADRFYNKAEAGYQRWQTQQLNGLDEFNARREWALPLSQIRGSYSAVGGYITSGFYIESTRRQRYDATATTDDASDNDNFLICLLRDQYAGFVTERNQAFTELSGVYSPETVYNVRLSPARMLRRHGPALTAGLIGRLNKRIRFTFGEGNNELRSRLREEPVAVLEKADLSSAELGAPLWYNESYFFTAPCTWQQAARVLAKPTGRIRFRNERGEWCEGWLLHFKHTLSEQLADFTLLRCYTLANTEDGQVIAPPVVEF